jgi:DNA polymerase-3 subunit delta'
MGAGTHPDVATLEPEAPGKALKIEEVRELIRLMSLKTVGQGPRIALVRDAHGLTIDAQSALLKLLEEPPGSALIVLVTENPSGLLATVRSRCQAFRFGAVAAQDLETLLLAAGRDAETARRAAALARGRVNLALDYSPELVADRDELISSVEQLPGGDGLGAEPLVAALAERMKQGRPGLEELLEWTIHRIETAVGFPPGAESPALAEILQNSSTADFTALLTRAEGIQRTIEALDRNANSRLALRDLLFDLENG